MGFGAFQGQAIAIDESTFYSGVDTQALIADQRLVRDPRFMLDSEFQAPRTIRLGLKFGFLIGPMHRAPRAAICTADT